MAAKGESASLPRSAAGPHNPWAIAVIVSIATFMEVLDTTIANVALRHIAGSLGAGLDESTYITTSYLVSNAIVLPISGWLANVIGRKRFYMSCVVIFTVSSVLCGFSTSLPMIIVFRVMQGIGGGGLAPTEQSIFADTFTPQQRALAFSIYGFTVVTAPAIGPMLGGFITDHYSWHWVFFMNLPVGLLSLFLTNHFISDSPTLKRDREKLLAKGIKIDYLGFLLIALGFGCLQIVLDKFEREDGFSSSFISTLSIISAISIVALIFRELRRSQPIVDLRLFRIRAFAISCVIIFAFGFVINSTTQLLPQLTQTLMGYDATRAGMTLGLGGMVSVFVMPLAGVITGRLIDAKYLVTIAMVGVGAGLWVAAGLNLDAGFSSFSLARLLQVVWLPLLFIPLSAVQFVGIPPDKNNNASALINMMRNLGGSFGVSIATTVLARREQFHHARLVEHVTAYNGFTAPAALQAVERAIEAQASMMSYLDIFKVLGWAALLLAPLCLFLPKLPKGRPVNAH